MGTEGFGTSSMGGFIIDSVVVGIFSTGGFEGTLGGGMAAGFETIGFSAGFTGGFSGGLIFFTGFVVGVGVGFGGVVFGLEGFGRTWGGFCSGGGTFVLTVGFLVEGTLCKGLKHPGVGQ